MSEEAILGAIIAAMVSYLAFIYVKISKSELKNRYHNLYIRRQDSLIHDSVKECLRAEGNKNLLTSYFYKVNFIDYFIKKVVPFSLFLGFFVIIFIAFTTDNFMQFKVKPSEALTKVSYMKDGQSHDLASGEIVYLSEGNFYKLDVNYGNLFSFNDKYVLPINTTLIFLTVVFLFLVLMAASNHWSTNSAEELDDNLGDSIKSLSEELEIVNALIDEASTKPEIDYKLDRINALDEKKSKIIKLIKSLENTQVNFSKL